MDLKQEPSDTYGVLKIKVEPDIFTEIKEEIRVDIDEFVVSKIEHQFSAFPEEIKCNSIQQFVSSTIKKELDLQNVVDISEIKQEVSDSEYKQFKIESELLTSYCDLPTLKNENAEYSNNFVQPCNSKYAERPLKTLKTARNVISKKMYPCLVCQKNFSSSISRLKHIDRHFGKSILICKFCGKFFTKIDFFRHYFIHLVKNEPIKISLRNKVSNMHQHEIIHTKEKPFKCDICSKQYNYKYGLHNHLVIHTIKEPLFKCDVCSRIFKCKSHLQYHLVAHTNKKPFKCNICFKEFKRKSNLQNHLIIHADEKPFTCDICSKQFNFKSGLQTHLIIHTKEEPFKCDICSKVFKRKSSLQEHLKIIHTNEKPFKCDICSKEIKRKSDFKKHFKEIHTDEKPFKCDICSKKFKRKSDLHNHLKMHTDYKQFKCEICCKEYKHKRNLQQHLLATHTN